MRDIERGRDIGRERSRVHAGSPTVTQSRVSRITPWAKGKHLTAEPPRDPLHIYLERCFCPASRPEPACWGVRDHVEAHGGPSANSQPTASNRDA